MRIIFLGYLGYITLLLLSEDPLQWVGFPRQQLVWIDMFLLAAHFLCFFMLTLLALAAAWPMPWWGIGTGLGNYALVTELLQGLTTSRHPEWMDFFQDLGGIAVGLGFGWLVATAWRSFRTPAQNVRVQGS